MCTRCDETKTALDHVVVAALKFARLTKKPVYVGFIDDALVIQREMFADPMMTVAIVTSDSTAQGLKSQVKSFMEQLQMLQRLEQFNEVLHDLQAPLTASSRTRDDSSLN